MNICKRVLSSLVDSLSDILKTFDIGSESSQIPLLKPKNEIGSTKSTYNFFAHYSEVMTEDPIKQIRLSFRFQNNKFCSFSIKKLEPVGINLYFEKLSGSIIGKFTTSTKTDSWFQLSVKYLRLVTMCSTFNPDCRYVKIPFQTYWKCLLSERNVFSETLGA